METTKVVLLEKNCGIWFETVKLVKSVNDLRSLFHPYEDSIIQVNIDKYRKVFYNYGFLDGKGVAAKVRDMDGEMHYMCSPILIVQCDDEKPINIESDVLNSIKELIDFC